VEPEVAQDTGDPKELDARCGSLVERGERSPLSCCAIRRGVIP